LASGLVAGQLPIHRPIVETMNWRRLRLPADSKIPDLGFEAFDMKPQRAASGKDEFHNASWRRGFLEANVQEIENEGFVLVMKAKARDLENAPEMQARPATLAARRARLSRGGANPIEPRRDHRELLRTRDIGHVADPDQSILKISRDHREIVGVEGNQSRKIGHRRLSFCVLGF
jgi:hypothetical protein